MDLRNLCSKLDVDTIRAKIPPLPQIKLPKSMSKLKSRKIFRSSRENVNSVQRGVSSKRKPSNCENLPLQLGPPTSEVINRTPTRISTISSLMNQREGGGKVLTKWKSKNDDDESFYRSAGGIDDYYPSPENHYFNQRTRISQPISPVRAPPITPEFRADSEQNIKMSFRERLQKGYKDVADLKLKHLFAKRTVVRTDKIEITEYVQRFDEDRIREERMQQNIDRNVADNYRFQFKASRQKSEESYINSPVSSPELTDIKRNYKTVSELSGDESGMESSPPTRKPGIASTRFSRVRHTPLNMSLEVHKDDDDSIHVVEDDESSKRSPVNSCDSRQVIDSYKLSRARHISLDRTMEDHDDDENCGIIDDIELHVVQDEEDAPKIKPNASSLYDIKRHQQTPEKQSNLRQSSQKSKSITDRMNRFSKQKSEGDEKKRRAPLSPQQSEENEADSAAAPKKSDKPFDSIKQNFKRFQKSLKLPQQASMQSGAESEIDEANPGHKTILTRTQQFSERIKRFRSTDQINKNPEDDENQESPIHKIANKLQEWKKSIRKKVDLQNTENDDDYAAGSPQKHVGSLMKKLKHIRVHKRNSADDPDDDEEGGETYKESLAARAKLQLEKGVVAASQVPQRTIKKISDTKKYFRKRQENDDKSRSDKAKSDEEEEDDQAKTSMKPAVKSISRPPPPIPRPYINDSSEEDDIDDKETFIAKTIVDSQIISVPAARAMWTTKPILSDDTTDNDDDLPRVLLHQDNSDVFESTLIIAVTRPISHVSEPIITELPLDSTEESTQDTKPDDWIPNQDTIASFLEMTPLSQRKLSKDSNATSNSRGHSRKHSIDSSSEDSWIKDIPRGPSIAVLNSVYENEEPWKIQKENSWDNLYKTKSIDLFELQKKHGGVLTAFEDFDDELKNTPVVKIENEEPQNYEIRRNVDNYDRESSEELENPDDDNSSRVTKISVHPPETKYNESSIIEPELKSLPYGNSRESLALNLDDKIVITVGEEGENKKSEESDDNNEFHEQNESENDRPPSKTPSPPPSIEATPPPLPKRQPSIRLSKLDQPSSELVCPSEPPPPLPLTKPPIPPNRPTPHPPKIPERNPTATRISKPLVKTASLRLAYSEQVNPEDVGKVNKLISQFEPEGPKQKPRIIPRKPWISNESEDYSDEDDSFEILPTKPKGKIKDKTPTNHPKLQKSFSIDSVDLPNNNEKLSTPSRHMQTSLSRKATSQIILNNSESATPIPSISISSTCLDVNSNFSQPSSVYGSPLAYPSSLMGSTEATPLTNRKESEYLGTRRNRRSMARDDEHFYSFDSDEENSYYSISSTSSNRNIVEL